jgi:hypothetical protein
MEMKKQIGLAVLATTLLFGGTSLEVLAAGKGNSAVKVTESSDGRHENGIGTGIISNLGVTEGPFYVGDSITLSAGDVVIDGPLDTLKWNVSYKGKNYDLGTFTLTEAGIHEFTVTATTYFKNGAKAGLVHSSTAPYVVKIEVLEVEQAIELISVTLGNYSYKHEKNNGGQVQYDLDATATFHFSDGNSIDVAKEFNNVQAQQSISFNITYKGIEFNKVFKAPENPYNVGS